MNKFNVIMLVACLGLSACSEEDRSIKVEHEGAVDIKPLKEEKEKYRAETQSAYTGLAKSTEEGIIKMKEQLSDSGMTETRRKGLENRIKQEERLLKDLKEKIANGK